MMKNGMPALLLAGLLAGGGTTALAQDGSYTLGKVTFQGNEKVSTAELMAALPFQPGQKLDHAGLQAESDAVGATYTKHNVGASIASRMTILNHTRVNIAYTITEKAPAAPVVTHTGITADSVQVQGNSKVSTPDILAAAKIQPGGPVSNESLAAAQGAIIGLYKKKNIGASVNSDFTNASQPGHVNIVFKITEKDD